MGTTRASVDPMLQRVKRCTLPRAKSRPDPRVRPTTTKRRTWRRKHDYMPGETLAIGARSVNGSTGGMMSVIMNLRILLGRQWVDSEGRFRVLAGR
jgi:hypothetical protein